MKFKENTRTLARHFMTGVSYMMPLVTAAGLLTSIGVIIGGQEAWEQGSSTIAGAITMLGSSGLSLITAVIAAYISYSIADKPGLIPAFIVGTVAHQMGTGFLGGMLMGVLTGYFVQFLKVKVKLPLNLQALKTVIIIPVFATLIIGLCLIYLIGTPIASMQKYLTDFLYGMQDSNAIILAAILGAMMAIDMGGPINKIAATFGLACFAEGIYTISTYMLAAISIPPLGMALATIFAKKLYSDEEIQNGRTALVMGIAGISEGAIPFAVADPISVIPSIITGTITTCALTAVFGVVHKTSLSTMLAIPFTNSPILYIVAIIVGSIVTAIMVNFIKMRRKRKED
ncbi:PTS fructose transporter subunit IIC [Helcococcus kunzii]|uniref:PTS system, Fru family, IIC component n=1 Tax=Helcococcus kunzii ATCC 51366 TaxID=883114 RepID=H3NQG3_9FIRM|nr:PTS fructose transporter subunit IIC [Helcococcus kunzii]EHR32293.1 PTS system, Fru family, IIC component [Helcococcus kunzii ATCC 51366]MCT1796463.1 PTS fructose transporter subunit IIC [Helcococcus kunzii]MCT1989060.1 PTS fructose transporter subunit IIC [Helcococcus kunzii]QUY65427.1 PTS fructose transporter subunit IIC [Helcococcus kunzii]